MPLEDKNKEDKENQEIKRPLYFTEHVRACSGTINFQIVTPKLPPPEMTANAIRVTPNMANNTFCFEFLLSCLDQDTNMSPGITNANVLAPIAPTQKHITQHNTYQKAYQ